ncbi:MAG: hypothetical protein SFZ24_08075 [Planctomycetota bacterium]|nr:hypothetical protein [Planctomycetota bacterium]
MRIGRVMCALVGALAAALPAVSASAQSFNIDFEGPPQGGPGTGTPGASYGAAAGQAGSWNRVFANQTPVGLFTLDGSATGVSLVRSGPLPHGGFNSPQTTGDREQLLDDFWNIDNGPAQAQFFGLSSGWYEVYTYAVTPGAAACRNLIQVIGAEVPESQVSGGVIPGVGFSLGITHTRHRVFVPNENTPLTVRISSFAGSCIAIGGMQLKQVAPCPEVDIQVPANFACICSGEDVKGDVTIASPGTIAFWYTQYKEINSLAWNVIDVGFSGGTSIPLGFFSTAGLSEGYYFIKTTAISGDGCFNEDTHIVYVDKSFETLDMTAPATGGVYGGTVCVGGLVNDRCLDRYSVRWAPLPAGAPLLDVVPGTPFYFGAFPIVGTWTGWDTIAAGVPDGEYAIVADARDVCGYSASDSARFIVDNTPPTAIITSPTNCEYVGCGVVAIKGTACDVNLSGWAVQYTGGGSNNWVTIATGNTCIEEDLLALWDTTGLPSCGYTIRLVVTDSSVKNCNSAIVGQSDFYVSVNVGLRGDVNGDGQVNFADITAVLQNWGASCP